MKIRALTVAAILTIGAAAGWSLPKVKAQPAQPDGPKVSVWSGVYTTAQSKRGEKVHRTTCAHCHGEQLDGAGLPDMPSSPGIAGDILLFKWRGKTMSELFTYVLQKMPPETPGTLSPRDAIDAVAHMLEVSEMPGGDKELPPDPKVLASIVIEAKPKK